jgi:hypothetical protein
MVDLRESFTVLLLHTLARVTLAPVEKGAVQHVVLHATLTGTIAQLVVIIHLDTLHQDLCALGVRREGTNMTPGKHTAVAAQKESTSLPVHLHRV